MSTGSCPAPLRFGAPLIAIVCALVAAAIMPAAAVGAARESTRLLVKVDGTASPAERGAVSTALGATRQEPLAAGWRVYELPGALSISEARAALGHTSADLAVELDRSVFVPSAVSNDPMSDKQWALDAVRAPLGWQVPMSAPITVAVLDTGIDLDHPDLADAAWMNPGEVPENGLDDDKNGYVDDTSGWDFVHNDGSVYDDPAQDAHGTHVAGIIGAIRDDGVGVAGVAANARLMSLKFFAGGAGLASDAIAAIGYARRNGARIVNASFEGPYSQALCDAVAAAAAGGVLIVAAAGNEAIDVDAASRVPAMCAEASVISVAASTPSDLLAPFSNRGATGVDLAAPGEAVMSTVPGDGHDLYSGTSMAAPHVAAAAALVLGQNPARNPAQVRQIILAAAHRIPGLSGVTATGGRLDVAGALGVPSTAVMPPTSAVTDDAVPLPMRRKNTARLLSFVVARRTMRADQVARLRFRVSDDTRVRFTVRRAATGALVSTFVRDAAEGDNVLLLSMRMGTRHANPAGGYRVTARPSAGAGAARSVHVDVVPGGPSPPADSPVMVLSRGKASPRS
jgi:subtilisin family serine protease